jgi:alkylation response protein AidB-like acyl-CoA dehydrogenase
MMQRLIETCVKYARERQQFGQPIGKYSAIANKVADMEVRLETGRLLLYKAAWLKSQGRHALREASMAKLYVSEATVQTCLDAIQIHGGYGYTTRRDFGEDLLRNFRDSESDHRRISRTVSSVAFHHLNQPLNGNPWLISCNNC